MTVSDFSYTNFVSQNFCTRKILKNLCFQVMYNMVRNALGS